MIFLLLIVITIICIIADGLSTKNKIKKHQKDPKAQVDIDRFNKNMENLRKLHNKDYY